MNLVFDKSNSLVSIRVFRALGVLGGSYVDGLVKVEWEKGPKDLNLSVLITLKCQLQISTYTTASASV